MAADKRTRNCDRARELPCSSVPSSSDSVGSCCLNALFGQGITGFIPSKKMLRAQAAAGQGTWEARSHAGVDQVFTLRRRAGE